MRNPTVETPTNRGERVKTEPKRDQGLHVWSFRPSYRPLRAKANAPALGSRCRPASKHQRAAQPHAVQLDESGRKVGKVPCHSELKFDGWMDGSSSIQLKTSRPRFEHMAANCAGKLLHESAFDCTRARH